MNDKTVEYQSWHCPVCHGEHMYGTTYTCLPTSSPCSICENKSKNYSYCPHCGKEDVISDNSNNYGGQPMTIQKLQSQTGDSMETQRLTNKLNEIIEYIQTTQDCTNSEEDRYNPTCGHPGVKWDEEGNCITCARDKVESSEDDFYGDDGVEEELLTQRIRNTRINKYIDNIKDIHDNFISKDEIREYLNNTIILYDINHGSAKMKGQWINYEDLLTSLGLEE